MSRSLLILAVLTLLARTVSAATIAVDRFDDSTAVAATACSAAPGDCSLRGAILKANGGGGDTIMLPAGTYNLTITNVVAPEDAAMTGDLDITKSVTITGAGSSTTIIDASGLHLADADMHPEHADRAIHVDPAGSGTLVVGISGVTIRNATTEIVAGVLASGAGIMNGKAVTGPTDPIGSSVTLTDVVLKNNTSAREGGGIANSGTLAITDSVIDGNTAPHGGGVFQGDNGSVQITNTTVKNNQTTVGGSGGGLWIGDFSTDANVPSATIMRSTFNDNQAGTGGGLFQNRGKVTLVNSTISHNTAVSGGGGILSNGRVTLQNCTVTLNVATTGGVGGIAGDVTASNTIVAGNTGSTTDCGGGTLTSGGHDLIGSTTGCTIAGDTATNLTGMAPDLFPLALNNGGTTATHKLMDGSPAVDHGSPAAPGSGNGACEATDQNGTTRPVGTSCDIGAYEGGLPATTTTPPAATPSPTPPATATATSTTTTHATTTSTTTTPTMPATSSTTTSSTTTTTSTTATTSTSTTTTHAATTTTTMLPGGDCGSEPAAATFASIDCRLIALLARVTTESSLGASGPKLVKNLSRAKEAEEAGGSACAASDPKHARKRLKQVIRDMLQYTHHLQTNRARKKLPGAVRTDLLAAGTPITDDVKSLQRTVQCPADAPR